MLIMITSLSKAIHHECGTGLATPQGGAGNKGGACGVWDAGENTNGTQITRSNKRKELEVGLKVAKQNQAWHGCTGAGGSPYIHTHTDIRTHTSKRK